MGSDTRILWYVNYISITLYFYKAIYIHIIKHQMVSPSANTGPQESGNFPGETTIKFGMFPSRYSYEYTNKHLKKYILFWAICFSHFTKHCGHFSMLVHKN